MMEEKFIDWLLQQRLEWLSGKGSITSEEALFTELQEGLTSLDRALTDSEKTCIALFIDRVLSERQTVYEQGVLDRIQLMKSIGKR